MKSLFKDKGDILRNQLSFHNCRNDVQAVQGCRRLRRNYPFAPYQFQLVQQIFEAIRKAGATGLHLSRGERSILDAFQSAGQAVADCEVGVLVPLYRSTRLSTRFLDTAVKRTIDQAQGQCQPKAVRHRVLRVLFLIRYVDEIQGEHRQSCHPLHRPDRRRPAGPARSRSKESLIRLEKDRSSTAAATTSSSLPTKNRTSTGRSRPFDLSSGEEAEALGEIIFDDVLKGTTKHSYQTNKMTVRFQSICDGFPYGSRVDKDLTVQVFSPLR